VNVLALCSGIGGIELGISLAAPKARTVCYVEREAYCAGLLAERMANGLMHEAPIWSDVVTFDGRPWRGKVDLVTGGYPCQPFSQAGKHLGHDDDRNLWFDFRRIIGEIRPSLVFCENVAAHLSNGFDVVVRDMGTMDYRVAACLATAWAVGAPHIRERLFWLASDAASSNGEPLQKRTRKAQIDRENDGNVIPTDADGRRFQIKRISRQNEIEQSQRDDVERSSSLNVGDPFAWRKASSPVCGMDDGIPLRLDRLRALGNAVVPVVAARAFITLANALIDER
jgi:DNA (cytosine-5)-methyltransferase 1